MEFLRSAFILESGKPYPQVYGVDPLFTPQGYAQYATISAAAMATPADDTAERWAGMSRGS